MFASKVTNIQDIVKQACPHIWTSFWTATDILILIAGVVANAALLWLFMQERKSLSASRVLGVNLVAMDLLYLSFMPVYLIYDTQAQPLNASAMAKQDFNTPPPIIVSRQIFDMFNLIGCPLLLACMCIERYLAVARPVLYLRVRKREYRVAVSAAVWFVTLSFCLVALLVRNIIIILMPISFIISCLFILMLACLGSMVRSLWQQSPAHTAHGNQTRSESPLKRRAVGNVLVVVMPAVMSYLPVLVMTPLLLFMRYGNHPANQSMCYLFELFMLFPKFGVLIGPMFYLSKAKQMCCLSGTGKKFHE